MTQLCVSVSYCAPFMYESKYPVLFDTGGRPRAPQQLPQAQQEAAEQQQQQQQHDACTPLDGLPLEEACEAGGDQGQRRAEHAAQRRPHTLLRAEVLEAALLLCCLLCLLSTLTFSEAWLPFFSPLR